MEQFDLADLQAWADGESSPQMLFEGDILRLVSRSLQELWPEAETGMTAEAALGLGAEVLSSFSGEGSVLFSAPLAGKKRDLQLTAWRSFLRVTVLGGTDENAMSAVAAVARSIMTPLGSVMAVTPDLLPLLTESGSPRDLRRAAQLNQGLYALMRTAGHLQTCGGNLNIPVSPRPENICRWLSDLMEEVRPLAEEARRNLTVKLPPRDYMCGVDGEKLKQALLNLISNAMKFTAPNGNILVQLKPVGKSRVCISIQDDGCGMSPGRLGKVFSLGGAADAIPDPRQGVGLGLPIARAIVQAHGGSLLLESQEKKGTTVYLYLQRSSIQPEQRLSSQIKHPTPFAGFSALLVELADALPASVFDTRAVDG